MLISGCARLISAASTIKDWLADICLPAMSLSLRFLLLPLLPPSLRIVVEGLATSPFVLHAPWQSLAPQLHSRCCVWYSRYSKPRLDESAPAAMAAAPPPPPPPRPTPPPNREPEPEEPAPSARAAAMAAAPPSGWLATLAAVGTTTEYSTYRTGGESWRTTLPYRRRIDTLCPLMMVAPRFPPLRVRNEHARESEGET
jgi:hypothetical protein